MASYIIEQCVIMRDGVGGYVTSGIGNMLNYAVTHNIFPEQVDLTLRKIIRPKTYVATEGT